MVIIELVGGLGNQMFQYAAGRALAYRNGVPLSLDISQFRHYPDRDYKLRHFNIVASVMQSEDVACLTRGGIGGALRRWILHMRTGRPVPLHSPLAERGSAFDPRLLQAHANVFLTGYWQSEKYFTDVEGIVRQELTVKHPPDPENQTMANRIHEVEAVSVHVRRGDYVSNPVTYQYHGVCPLEYYHAAVKRVTKVVKQPHLFIFSDDIGWAQENLELDYARTYVAHNGPEKDYEDLRLMRQCQHHIIANSTFSWWGAWLCTNPSKIVVAPEQWFADADQHARDLLPDSWHRI